MRIRFTLFLMSLAGTLLAQQPAAAPDSTTAADTTYPAGVGVFAPPAVPADPPTDLFGTDLRTWLKTNWYTGKYSQLGYDNARRAMYNSTDGVDNVPPDNTICVYTGYNDNVGSDTYPDPINTEHTIPQSFFDDDEPMRGDMHHLFPSHENTNSARSNNPFGEVPDGSARWYGATSPGGTATMPTVNIEEWSEGNSSPAYFEPREDHKGDVARALFYFYTMYPGQANVSYTPPAGDTTGITRVVYSATNNTLEELQLLYSWHVNDPPSAKEIARNAGVADAQGNYNPYIEHPDIVARAFSIPVAAGNTITASTGGVLATVSGANITVNWTVTGTFDPGNTFTVELSDATGSFASPVTIGTKAGTGSDNLLVTIPSNTPAGDSYRVRVNGSDPATTGTESATFIVRNDLEIASTVPNTLAREEIFTVDYTSTGVYNAGNEFRVVMSNSTGGYGSGTRVIGTLSSTALSGTITATMPADAPLSGPIPFVTVRVEATNPATQSSASGTITITPAATVEPGTELQTRLFIGPNPTYGPVHLQGSLAAPTRLLVEVYNSQGQRVYASQLPQSAQIDHWLELTPLAPGLYTLRVTGTEDAAHWRILRK